MGYWLLLVGGAVALVAYAGRGRNAVWGTATVALPIGIVAAFLFASVQAGDILTFVAVGALIGLVFELPSLVQKRRSDEIDRDVQTITRNLQSGGEDVSSRLSSGLARMPSAPDIDGAKQFYSEKISGRTVLGFRDCPVMAKRRGARATLEYPFVLALLDNADSEVCMFVAVEKGVMFDTCMLGVFTNEGDHFNMGPWDPAASEETFLDEAKAILLDRLKQEEE